MGCFTLVLTSPLGELTPPDFEVSVVSVVVPGVEGPNPIASGGGGRQPTSWSASRGGHCPTCRRRSRTRSVMTTATDSQPSEETT